MVQCLGFKIEEYTQEQIQERVDALSDSDFQASLVQALVDSVAHGSIGMYVGGATTPNGMWSYALAIRLARQHVIDMTRHLEWIEEQRSKVIKGVLERPSKYVQYGMEFTPAQHQELEAQKERMRIASESGQIVRKYTFRSRELA